ncbi:hypothetical protein [Nocardia suismassiliense]|uniref:hypothetical protein n=1 Tax=Nocardia suismassiliense TaxID=2077092 RepID=UPI00131F2B01|nr:hypothetical protein [Nocardia suismassiliense]
MVRTQSPADTELLAHLKGIGLRVSAAQLERWRHAGALPKHRRTYPGRGSKSVCEMETVRIAEALAVTTRRGRSIYESVLEIFTIDPHHQDLLDSCLDIPETGIRSALMWFLTDGSRTLDRRIERAIQHRRATSEDAVDIAYRLASQQFRQAKKKSDDFISRTDPWHRLEGDNVEIEALWHALAFGGDVDPGADIVAEAMLRSMSLFSADPHALYDEERIAIEKLFGDLERTGKAPGHRTQYVPTVTLMARLVDLKFTTIRETRDKLARVAELGRLCLLLHGRPEFEDSTEHMFAASTSSIDANALFHMIVPIATSLRTDAWHRMAALIVLILLEDRSYLPALDLLAAATRKSPLPE